MAKSRMKLSTHLEGKGGILEEDEFVAYKTERG